ncbi:hypothetical protein [Thermogutta sp.]|uniref:hypothetical protein n=1 Tax=Thermogutta sp. TaxID=1962930 RepID=UPI0032201C11
MNGPNRLLRQWSNLPDPRQGIGSQTLSVLFFEQIWHHCLKHWTSRHEPWDEEFGKDVIARLRNLVDVCSPEGQDVVNRVLEVLEKQTQASLVRPQVLILTLATSTARDTKWLLVLPSGAIAILRGTECVLRWVTCYYLCVAAVERKRRERWKATVREVIRRYVPVRGDPPQWLMPTPQDALVLRGSEGKVGGCFQNLQFITPENWGFEPELTGCPWRGRLPSWPEAEQYDGREQPNTRRRWFKPRRWWEDYEDYQ